MGNPSHNKYYVFKHYFWGWEDPPIKFCGNELCLILLIATSIIMEAKLFRYVLDVTPLSSLELLISLYFLSPDISRCVWEEHVG